MQSEQTEIKLATLAALMILENGGETARAEDTALHISASLGLKEAQIIAFPTGFVFSASINGISSSRVVRIRERLTRLDLIDEVNRVSRALSARQLSAEEALERLNVLRSAPRPGLLKTLIPFALSVGFFALLMGGKVAEFLLSVFIAGMVQLFKPLMHKVRLSGPLYPLFAGFLSAIFSILVLRLFSASQEIVIAAVIMPLLPGMSMTNAIRDTIRGDLLSGLSRAAEALFVAVLLAAGVALGLIVGR